MATKKELLEHIELMCANDSPVSFQNKGAFLLKLFMYPMVDWEYIIENLSIAVMSAQPNIIEVITIYRVIGAESKYQYLIEYNLVCTFCENKTVEQTNVFGKYFPSICNSCHDMALDSAYDQVV